MSSSTELKNLEQSVEETKKLLEQMEGLFKTFKQPDAIRQLQDAPIEERVNTLQLVLQYRMDGQDAMVKLMQIEESLLQLLGVEHLASKFLNLENLAYALSSEDFKVLLSDLNALIDKLLKIIHKYQMQHRHYIENKQPEKQNTARKSLQQKVQKLSFMQRQLINQLAKIQQDLNLFFQVETLGPVRDHIVALRGPISRFYQLILSGLKQSQELYRHLNPEPTMSMTLEPILGKANETLQQMALQSVKNHYFKPQEAPAIKPSSLEARAEKKRLGHFFHI